jgi:hypothetical protein
MMWRQSAIAALLSVTGRLRSLTTRVGRIRFRRGLRLSREGRQRRQALGSYRGGKMLFLGLGTGLGSTVIVNGVAEPMELSR